MQIDVEISKKSGFIVVLNKPAEESPCKALAENPLVRPAPAGETGTRPAFSEESENYVNHTASNHSLC